MEEMVPSEKPKFAPSQTSEAREKRNAKLRAHWKEVQRMTVKGFTLKKAENAIKVNAWEIGKLTDQQLQDYTEIWDWLSVRAKKEGLDIEKMGSTSGGVCMTVEYMRAVLMDEMVDFEVKKFMQKCGTRLDDYLKWYESDLAKFVFRSEQLFENDRIKSQVHLVRKELLKGIKSGDNKKIDMWLKATGRAKGEEPDEEGFNPTIVDKYLDEKGRPV